MKSIGKLFRQNLVVSSLFLALAIVYIAQILTNVPSGAVLQKYHVTSAQLHQLSLTIAVPYIVIWAIGLIGYLRLRTYTDLLKNGDDKPGFRTLTRGVFLFTLWLPISTLLASIASGYYGNHPASTAALTIFVNYINLVILFAAFYIIKLGAERLLVITKNPQFGMSQLQTAVFLAFSALYVFIVFHDPVRQVATGATMTATYYQPDWLVLVTIVIPRLIMWYLGLTAAASIISYQQRVKGSIYKKGLHYLALGIAGVVISTIVLRVVQSLSSTLSSWSLGVLLVFIYVLLIIIGIGYALIASGAKRLQKIEES